MTASTPRDLSPTVLADPLSPSSSAGLGAIIGVPVAEAWILALQLAPLRTGDRVLMTRAGEDSARWATMAQDLGYDVVCIDVPPGDGPSLDDLTHLLWWDPSIKGVFVARDETSTGITADVGEVRRVIDLTGSDALLLVACSDTWGVDAAEQRAWSADLVVTALDTSSDGPHAGTLLSWSGRLPELAAIPDLAGSLPDDILSRLRSRLDGLQAMGPSGRARRVLSEGLRRGLAAAGLEAVARDRPSDTVTVVRLPAGIHAPRLAHVLAAQCHAETDLGVGDLEGRVLRIRHDALRDEVDVLAVVSTVELALRIAGSPATGTIGLETARAWFSAQPADAC